MDPQRDRHHLACTQFADGIALMTRRQFGDAYQRLCEAYDLLLELCRDPFNPDVVHTDLFRAVVVLAGDPSAPVADHANMDAAQGMLRAWQGCQRSALGTDAYHRDGGLSSRALDYYGQAVAEFETAIPLLDAGLGHDHPELLGPLGDYGGVLRAVGREADADRVHQRVLALPPSALSAAMVGGGYPIIMLDPFGTNPPLPSQTE